MIERLVHSFGALSRPLGSLAQSLGTLARPLEGLTHLLFPQVCVVCRKTLTASEQQLCSACLTDFAPFPDPLAGGQAVIRSVNSHFGLGAIPSAAWGLYPYRSNGALHDALHAMKYEGLFPLGRLFGRWLGELVQSAGGPGEVVAIVPVPLHPLKRIERSYNQSEAIASGMAEVLDLPVVEDAIERSAYTGSQTGLGITERRKNMAGVFRPVTRNSRRISGRVVLVDDVLTTGATMVAAASALKEAGVDEVAFAVVAVTEEKE